jgi:hypothetical protein
VSRSIPTSATRTAIVLAGLLAALTLLLAREASAAEQCVTDNPYYEPPPCGSTTDPDPDPKERELNKGESSAPGVNALPPATRRQLEQQGGEAAQLAAKTEESAPAAARRGARSGQGAGGGSGPASTIPGPDPQTQSASLAGSDSGAGLGALFPLLLVGSALAALVVRFSKGRRGRSR